MDAVRTPESRFADLPDWPYAPRYLEALPGFSGLRLHYIDEGPRDGEVFLCLHGEPTWSYLYRKMIPVFTAAGKRVIAPDWFGFGRSDKPIADSAYSFAFHRDTLTAVIDALELDRFVLVCQDWGGLLGLTLPVTHADHLAGLVVMNTALAIGQSPGEGFLRWRDYVANSPDFDVGRLMGRSVAGITPAEIAAYDAPFPGPEYKAGVRTFPALVPIDPEMPGAATSRHASQFWAKAWSGPSFMAIGVQDPVLGPKVMRALHGRIRGCPPPLELPEGGHFVQECGAVVAEAALAALAEQRLES